MIAFVWLPIVTSSTPRKKRQVWRQHWNPPNYATQPHTTTLQLSTDATLRTSKITQKFKRVTKTLGELRESISIKTNFVKSWNGTFGFGEPKFRNSGFSNLGDCNRNLVSTHKCEGQLDWKISSGNLYWSSSWRNFFNFAFKVPKYSPPPPTHTCSGTSPWELKDFWFCWYTTPHCLLEGYRLVFLVV